MKTLISVLFDYKCKEIHIRITSPPIRSPCYYGIDTPSREELMASQFDIDAMAEQIGVDSLAFISLKGLYMAVGGVRRDLENPKFCDACFTGEYPISLVDLALGRSPRQLSLLAEHN